MGAYLLDVKEELKEITVLNDVILTLGAQLAGLLGTLLTVIFDVIIIGDGLGTDEAAFKV